MAESEIGTHTGKIHSRHQDDFRLPNQDFYKNVFINCPLDDEYKPILEAILFCLIRLGFNPRIATEKIETSQSRLDKIRKLIRSSKYSIHDLSRCSPSYPNELSRMNMPFELGLDFGCKDFGGSPFNQKMILVLEKEQYRYQKFISDLSGSDIESHENSYVKAIRKVRNWIRSFEPLDQIAADRVVREYEDFRGKHYDKLRSEGFSEEDIEDYPTTELIDAITQWLQPNLIQ